MVIFVSSQDEVTSIKCKFLFETTPFKNPEVFNVLFLRYIYQTTKNNDS